jgi:hypothetical protein
VKIRKMKNKEKKLSSLLVACPGWLAGWFQVSLMPTEEHDDTSPNYVEASPLLSEDSSKSSG